jgi:serine/threonine-protein kinase
MKCLEKDRNRRYETVNGLRLDVERYLADEPVQACPPSAWYRFRKFARRNRTGLAVAGLILSVFVLLGGGAGWVVRDRAARLTMTEQEVIRALGEATTLQGQSKWPEALEAARRAEGFLAAGAGELLHRRVEELLKDLRMVLHLDEIGHPRASRGTEGPYDNRRADASYAEAFRRFGIDVDVLEPAEAARRIRSRSIRLELAATLDWWADRRQGELTKGKTWDGWPDQRDHDPEANDSGWKRLIAVARAADPDEWRDQVRSALERRDRGALYTLTASSRFSDLPVPLLSTVCRHVENEHTKAALRRAQLEHPDNYYINNQLAWNNPAPDEAIRFYTAALVARPRNAMAAYHLGAALSRRGRLDEAIAAFRKAIALDPDLEWSYIGVIEALRAQNKRDEAIAEIHAAVTARPDHAPLHHSIAWTLSACSVADPRARRLAVELGRRAVELAPDDGDCWRSLGAARYRAGDWKAAIEALEKSEVLAPDKNLAFNGLFLAMACWQLERRDEARQWYDRAVGWIEKYDPKHNELRRVRAEASALLGLPEPAAPVKKEVTRPSKP